MAFSGICLRDLNDLVDEIFADGCYGHAGTTDAAADDDIFYAGNDAVGNVVGTVRTAVILVLRQHCQLWPADGDQPSQQAQRTTGNRDRRHGAKGCETGETEARVNGKKLKS